MPRWRIVAAAVVLVGTVVLLLLPGQDRGLLLITVVPVLLVAVAGLLAAPARPRPGRQHDALAAWASAAGWAFAPVDSTWADAWRGPPFDHGQRHATREVLRGERRGLPAVSCTVRWNEPTAAMAGTTRHYAHLVAVRLPGALPALHLSPHTDDGARELGSQDVVTESSAFNAHWRVRGPDLRGVHGVLHPVVMERLMADDLRGTHVTTEGCWLLVRWPGPTVLDLLDRRIDAAVDLARRVPGHVRQGPGYHPRTTRPPEEPPCPEP